MATEKRIVVRLYGLPYAKPRGGGGRPGKGKDGKEPTPEQKRAAQKRAEMMKLLSAKPGTIRHKKNEFQIRRSYCQEMEAAA